MTGTVPVDRRQRRRQETIEQVLDVAVEVMADQGVAGLTLGEVARRMGIRPPSLYVYFDGKNALYDALFERGWRELLAVLRAARDRAQPQSPEDAFRTFSEVFVRWAVGAPGVRPADVLAPGSRLRPVGAGLRAGDRDPAHGPRVPRGHAAARRTARRRRPGPGVPHVDDGDQRRHDPAARRMRRASRSTPARSPRPCPTWWPCGWPTTADDGTACPTEPGKAPR